jgi:diguanylate cyclase (GGDEF)-like protein
MTPSENPELQEVAELLIQRRLREHTDDLQQRKQEIEEKAAQPGSQQGVVARGLLVGAWTDTLQQHCQQVLTDLMVLLKIFDTLSSVEWIQQMFEAHVDQVAADLVSKLKDDSFGVSFRSSEQNKVINLAAAIKAGIQRRWDRAIERAVQKQREDLESSAPPPSELDDRLPLSRRGSFDRDLINMAKAVKRTEQPLSLVMIDIDHFKNVNDQYGHPVGDEVLLAVAELVIKRLAHKGKAFRYGGEEFALLLANYSTEEAVGLAERIRKDIQAAIVGSKRLKVTASFGVATVPDNGPDSETVLEMADTALYEAKELGRNRVRFSGEPKSEDP